MNLQSICEGLIAKNYKEMCGLLDEPIKSGKSKVLQMEDWKRYFDFEKQGHKIIINKIYEDVIEKVDSKTNKILSNVKSGKYSKDVFPMVKNFVGKHDIEYISKSKLLKELGLINQNYTMAYLYPKEFTKYINAKYNQDISEDCINTIVNSLYTVSHDKIHNAFNNLEKLEYIYSYSNKILMVYYKDTYKVDMPTEDECKILNKCIYEGKIKALSNFFSRSKQPMESYINLKTKIKEDCNNSIDKMNKKLNVELFLRGLSKEAHDISIKEIRHISQFENINNFFYVYGYIKNEDIEWDKELLDIAKENIHLNNYKEQVKNMFILDTFLDKWFESEHINDKNINKYEFKTQYETHKRSVKDIINILFDILTSSNENVIIDENLIKKPAKNSKEQNIHEDVLELPF